MTWYFDNFEIETIMGNFCLEIKDLQIVNIILFENSIQTFCLDVITLSFNNNSLRTIKQNIKKILFLLWASR